MKNVQNQIISANTLKFKKKTIQFRYYYVNSNMKLVKNNLKLHNLTHPC